MTTEIGSPEHMRPVTMEEQAAYAAGREAFVSDQDAEANPHPSGKTITGFNQCRYWWFMGWYDARHMQQLF